MKELCIFRKSPHPPFSKVGQRRIVFIIAEIKHLEHLMNSIWRVRIRKRLGAFYLAVKREDLFQPVFIYPFDQRHPLCERLCIPFMIIVCNDPPSTVYNLSDLRICNADDNDLVIGYVTSFNRSAKGHFIEWFPVNSFVIHTAYKHIFIFCLFDDIRSIYPGCGSHEEPFLYLDILVIERQAPDADFCSCSTMGFIEYGHIKGGI